MTGRGLNEVGGTVMSVEQTAKPECLGRPGNLTVCHKEPHGRPKIRAVPDPATAVLSWLMAPGSGEQLPSLEEVLRRPSWMELAACAGMPIDVFFPAKGQTAAAARAICATCKVQPECLDYARADSDTMGFWGGTSERERRHHGQVA
jgi:WhiB family redox-sensing transcriptional regulator